MVKKKYQQLLLYTQFGGITTIDDTQMLVVIKQNKNAVCIY